VPIWFAVWAPAGTPADVIATLNRKIAEIGATPEMKARMREIRFALPDDFSIAAMPRFFDDDTMANAALIKEARISLS
jgi:tripartite-type tricarboxylate transporter receptor subunit TctC